MPTFESLSHGLRMTLERDERSEAVIQLLANEWPLMANWDWLRGPIQLAIRQAVMEEREALVGLVMNDAYAASFQTLGQYRVALKDAIRERK